MGRPWEMSPADAQAGGTGTNRVSTPHLVEECCLPPQMRERRCHRTFLRASENRRQAGGDGQRPHNRQ